MNRIARPVRALFLDTPAGFQLNVDQLSTKAVDYFQQRLELSLSVASFKSAEQATPVQVENVLRRLRTANYIFAGPGSPSYTVSNWQDTAVLTGIAQRLVEGAHLVLASAAAIAAGRHALPVYEIYKAGQEPHWLPGLDLLGPYGLELAIVPHFNNTEGGNHDTRFCFMGEPRLKELEAQLPDSAVMLGVDEHTACTIDLPAHRAQVMGAGQVTVRCRGCERYYPAGTSFSLDMLKANPENNTLAVEPRPATETTLPPVWDEWAEMLEETDADTAAVIDLAVWVRDRLRQAKQWALADEIRDRLADLGIVLEDGPTETSWKRPE